MTRKSGAVNRSNLELSLVSLRMFQRLNGGLEPWKLMNSTDLIQQESTR